MPKPLGPTFIRNLIWDVKTIPSLTTHVLTSGIQNRIEARKRGVQAMNKKGRKNFATGYFLAQFDSIIPVFP